MVVVGVLGEESGGGNASASELGAAYGYVRTYIDSHRDVFFCLR